MLTSISPPVSGGRGRGCVWTDAIFHHILIMSLLSVLRLTIPHPPRPPPLFHPEMLSQSGRILPIESGKLYMGLYLKYVCVCVRVCQIYGQAMGGWTKETSIRSNQA